MTHKPVRHSSAGRIVVEIFVWEGKVMLKLDSMVLDEGKDLDRVREPYYHAVSGRSSSTARTYTCHSAQTFSISAQAAFSSGLSSMSVDRSPYCRASSIPPSHS